MGYGIDFKANVYLNKMKFNDIQEVNAKIEDNVRAIRDAKQKIQMFVSATPNSIVPKEWEDEPINWLVNPVNDLFELIEDYTRENVLLNQYLSYLENNKIKNNDDVLLCEYL
jgi:hypothetical protein